MRLQYRTVQQIDHIATGMEARMARKKAGKTLAYIAKKLGFGTPYIHQLELGRANWSEALLKRFEKAL